MEMTTVIQTTIAALVVLSAILLIRRWLLLKRVLPSVEHSFKQKSKSFKEITKEYFITKSTLNINTPARIVNNQINVSATEQGTTEQQGTEKDLGILAATGESGITGVEYFSGYLAANNHFYQAISALAGHQIDTFADLHEHVANYSHTFWNGVSNGVVNKVQGHVAEQIVAEHLQHLGHHVEFPLTSNQQGYDLIVDGTHLYNVKDVAAASSISSHFAHNPDINVIVPQHFGDWYEHAIHIDASTGIDHLGDSFHHAHSVVVDGGLDHDHVVNQTHHALDAAQGHVPGFHFPVVALALSSWREGNLLVDGSTEVTRSLKNVLCDVTGTGIGGGIGAKGGAAIGTFFMPGIGTGIGAILGGIAGAMAGRFFTNEVKFAPLKEASAQYSSDYDNYKESSESLKTDAENKYQNELAAIKADLERSAQNYKQVIAETIAQSNSAIADKVHLSQDAEKELIRNVRAGLAKERELVDKSIEELPFFKKYIWPDQFASILFMQKRICAKRKIDFEIFAAMYQGGRLQSNVEDIPKFFETCLEFGYGEMDAQQYLTPLRDVIIKSRENIKQVNQSCFDNMLSLRSKKMGVITKYVEKLSFDIDSALRPTVKELKNSEAILKKEMKAFGQA